MAKRNVRQDAVVTNEIAETEAQKFQRKQTQPEPVEGQEHVKVKTVTDELVERKGRLGLKGGESNKKIVDFKVYEVDSVEGIVPALRLLWPGTGEKSDKAIQLAVNNLLLKIAMRRANKKAFGVDKNIAAVVKMLIDGGMTEADAIARANAAFAGQK
jgi:hypothetical protein